MLPTFVLLVLSFLTITPTLTQARKYPYYKPLPRRSCNTADPSTNLATSHEYLALNEATNTTLWNSTMIQDHLSSYHPLQRRTLSLLDIPNPYLHTRAAPTSYLYTIPVWMHIVMNTSDNTASSPYYVTTSMLNSQLSYLNNAYASSSISFILAGTTKTLNETWSLGADDLNMKTTLRKGNYSTLNIYYQTHLRTSSSTPGIPSGSVLLGFCSLPSSGITPSTSPSVYVSDGCNVLSGTLPGSYETGYNKGGTTAHEVGHWNGLLHTFQNNNCEGGDWGDFVADTPQESVSTTSCPTTKDSCPDSGVAEGSYGTGTAMNPYTPQGFSGPDPIHNFMDYSSDACYTGFTPGQGARMANLWVIYREGR